MSREALDTLLGARLQAGTSLCAKDIADLRDEATRPEADRDVVLPDGSRRTVDPEEHAILATDLFALGADRFDAAARLALHAFENDLPKLLHPASTAREVGRLDEKRSVFIDSLGRPRISDDLARLATPDETEEAFHRLALLVRREARKEANPFDGLSKTEKTKLSNAASAALAGPAGRERRKLRSAAATVLWGLVRGLPQADRLTKQIHDTLVRGVRAEAEPALARDMVARMCRRDYLRKLEPADAANVRDVLFTEIFPAKFPVEAITDRDGYLCWDQAVATGEGFLRGFLWKLDNAIRIHGAKFEAKERDPYGGGKFELTFPDDVRQRLGIPVAGIRLNVRPLYRDIYKTLGERTGFGSFSHASVGGNQERSLVNAMIEGKKPNGPQVAFIGLCAGLDGRHDLERLSQDNVTVITTYDSSFFDSGTLRDKDGEFAGETDSEDTVAWTTLLEGLTAGRSWKEIEEATENALAEKYPYWSHSVDAGSNYIFPTLRGYENAGFTSVDPDGDGVTIDDVYSSEGCVKLPRDPDREFVHCTADVPFEQIEGSAILNAVLDANVATHYASYTEGERDLEHRLAASGFFPGGKDDPMVRIEKGANPYTSAAQWNVSVNSGLGHTSREAMQALVPYAAIMEWADQGAISDLDEVDRKLMALVFAAFRLEYDEGGSDSDNRIWKQLLAAMQLPASLPLGPLLGLLEREHTDYAGNGAMLEAYRCALPADVLAALAKPEVGRGYRGK